MNTLVTVAIAEPSIIIKAGLESLLKHLSGIHINIIDIQSADTLIDQLRMNKPDLLLINPTIPGMYSLQQIKEEANCKQMKCIALSYQLADASLIRPYDEQLNIFDSVDEIRFKLSRLIKIHSTATDSEDEEQQALSAREKEIVIGVVKGMTNKEIADSLFLSTHTVITHRRNIARKLQIHSASGLTIYAIVNKLIELSDIQ